MGLGREIALLKGYCYIVVSFLDCNILVSCGFMCSDTNVYIYHLYIYIFYSMFLIKNKSKR